MSCLDFKQPHGQTETVRNYGGDPIAEQCRVCHSVAGTYGKCAYASCNYEGLLRFMKKIRMRPPAWFCTEECKANWEGVRKNESLAAKIAKDEAAKKKFAAGNR